MSTYPSLRVSSEAPNESWRQIPRLDSYFLERPAENWHPEDFERNTTHTDLNVFLRDLARISRCRLASVSTYAGDILSYLSTTAGEELKKKVQEKLEFRKMAYLNQLSYSKLQVQYSTESYLDVLNESKRKRFLDSANGSLSASTTSTPVPLKRGRISRRKTTLVAVPASVPMAPDTVPTFDPSASSSSRPRIDCPWHDLVQAALSLYEGVNVELPSEQSGAAEQDPEKRTLYKLALGHLQNAQAEMQQPKFDRTSCIDFKDAFIALSGVWNVFSKEANMAFQSADRQEVEELCKMGELEHKDADVTEILNTLADKSRKAPLTDVVDELCTLLSTKPERRPLLMVLLAILRHVIRPHHGSIAPSEADSLYLWARIFDDGMPLNTPFSFHLGEQGCAATALSKSQLAKVFDTGFTARKCDCLFTVKGLEVGNVEAKRISAPKLEVAFQLRKNIKINKSILLQLEKYGVECPPLLSLHGNTAVVFRVRRWKRIFVASKACPTLVLPTTGDEWPLFLSRHAHVLSNLLEHYHTFSRSCAESYSLVQYEEQAAAEDELVSLTREEQATLLEWEHVVLHTPTKPKLTKKISYKAPDTALFWRRIEEAAKDREDEDGRASK
ncbi:hypothetical protein BC939DRAFT_447189 [Gamsiella multidivaricata]|uniref:uncharacterized protein n=1 Tax=Gamsiella multidivaricata TaxID=101098 RepID=UPI0022205338|nr:uncharacterized protein BC939DRAFT_447189 [Gamsiella multidivaricata]KAI7826190.1 hypothetical protein BC939DRAFT_447189 [Gamsiella multidivaricata]